MNKTELAVQAERERMASVASDAQQKVTLISAANYTAVPFLPQSKAFIQKYILSNIEYPTLESKLVQALTELQVRMNNLAQHSLELQKMELTIEKHEIDKEQLGRDASESDHLEVRRLTVASKELDLEITGLKYRLVQTRAKMDQIYTELKNWKETVDELLANLGVSSPHEIDYTKVKLAEMEVKIKIWKQLKSQGHMEITPSQMNVILANPEAWGQ
jgi:hypothetical protein